MRAIDAPYKNTGPLFQNRLIITTGYPQWEILMCHACFFPGIERSYPYDLVAYLSLKHPPSMGYSYYPFNVSSRLPQFEKNKMLKTCLLLNCENKSRLFVFMRSFPLLLKCSAFLFVIEEVVGYLFFCQCVRWLFCLNSVCYTASQ